MHRSRLPRSEAFETIGAEISLLRTNSENTALAENRRTGQHRSRILWRLEPNGHSFSGARPRIGRSLRRPPLTPAQFCAVLYLGLRSNQRPLTPPGFSPFTGRTIHLPGRFIRTSQRFQRLQKLSRFTKHSRCILSFFFLVSRRRFAAASNESLPSANERYSRSISTAETLAFPCRRHIRDAVLQSTTTRLGSNILQVAAGEL